MIKKKKKLFDAQCWFIESGELVKGINHTFITLVLKKKGAIELG